MQYFKTVFLKDAEDFVTHLSEKMQHKIFYNIRFAEQNNDQRFFKKLNNDIWEFRTFYNGQQIRLLAFWDRKETPVLVLATHGFVKKVNKVPLKELQKAIDVRKKYFENKENNNP